MPDAIVIDPGHGGERAAGKSTPIGRRGGLGTLERDVAFQVAGAVADALGGATLTRASGDNRSLAARIAVARSSGAAAFVSIHADACDDDGAPQAWVHPRASGSSRALAAALLRRLGQDSPPLAGGLAVLDPARHAAGTAACLIELGDLADSETEAWLRDESGRRSVARAIADGIHDFLAAAGPSPAGRALDAPSWTAYLNPPLIIAQYVPWTCWAAALESWSSARPGPGWGQRELVDRFATVKPLADADVPLDDPSQPARVGSLDAKDFPAVATELGLDYRVIAGSALSAQDVADHLRDHGPVVLVYNMSNDPGAPSHTVVCYGVGYPDGNTLMYSVMDPMTATYRNISEDELHAINSLIVGWPAAAAAAGAEGLSRRRGRLGARALEVEAVCGAGEPGMADDEAAAVMDAIASAPSEQAQARRARPRAQSVTYDRSAAVAYARDFAAKVCSDGFIAGSFHSTFFKQVPLDTTYEPDGSGGEQAVQGGQVIATWSELDDCAHFVSCCIGSPPGGTGGGLRVLQPQSISIGPPYAPYGLISPLGLKTWFASAPDIAEIVGDRSSDSTLIDRLAAGDVILYHNGHSYQHSAVYLGDGTIACHTICRFGLPWQIDAAKFTWTFVRIQGS